MSNVIDFIARAATFTCFVGLLVLFVATSKLVL